MAKILDGDFEHGAYCTWACEARGMATGFAASCAEMPRNFYEGASIADFISTLKSSGVSVVLDIREIPLSRRTGFSKQALSQALAASGIEYLHERALGSPKAIRDALHRDKDYKKFFRLFEDYLDTRQALLNGLAERLNGNVALLCYERDPNLCHRLIVAGHLAYLTGASI
jgi:uncharacterized protein (DUF488 family)